MKPSIKIENLSKQYRLGVIGTGTLSHDLKRWWTTSIRGKEDPYLKIGETNVIASRNPKPETRNSKLETRNSKPETRNPKPETRNSKLETRNSKLETRNSKLESQYVWALKDINLEIEQGDVVGIIGKNGAGKSTLLKILSRVTKPTTGSIKYNGRIASLLEVGTGFHPEMTGRENIYMNGAIMGMTRHEITSKLDEIIAFAGVERYIDTPVKRYSSGMTVRLGFSIAAHLEPDILVVDEVLAVGDAEFQKKAIGKMQDVSKGGGRTVLFVSHNMASIQGLCKNAIFLKDGMVQATGTVSEVIDKYLFFGAESNLEKHWDAGTEPGNEIIKFKNYKIIPANGESSITIDTGVEIDCEIIALQPNLNLGFTLYLTNSQGILLFESGVVLTNNKDSKIGVYKVNVSIPAHTLNSDRYTARILIGESQRYVLANFDEIFTFEIEHTSTGRDNNFSKAPGVIRPLLDWKSKFVTYETY